MQAEEKQEGPHESVGYGEERVPGRFGDGRSPRAVGLESGSVVLGNYDNGMFGRRNVWVAKKAVVADARRVGCIIECALFWRGRRYQL